MKRAVSGIHLYDSDLHFNRAEKGSFNSSHLYLYLVSPLVPQKMSRHQSCKRMGLVQLLVMSIKSISEFLDLYNSRIARGVPLPVYMNLDVYSGFWCTSRCVVF